MRLLCAVILLVVVAACSQKQEPLNTPAPQGVSKLKVETRPTYQELLSIYTQERLELTRLEDERNEHESKLNADLARLANESKQAVAEYENFLASSSTSDHGLISDNYKKANGWVESRLKQKMPESFEEQKSLSDDFEAFAKTLLTSEDVDDLDIDVIVEPARIKIWNCKSAEFAHNTFDPLIRELDAKIFKQQERVAEAEAKRNAAEEANKKSPR